MISNMSNLSLQEAFALHQHRIIQEQQKKAFCFDFTTSHPSVKNAFENRISPHQASKENNRLANNAESKLGRNAPSLSVAPFDVTSKANLVEYAKHQYFLKKQEESQPKNIVIRNQVLLAFHKCYGEAFVPLPQVMSKFQQTLSQAQLSIFLKHLVIPTYAASPLQIRVLKRHQIIPSSFNQCKLISQSSAERLLGYLLNEDSSSPCNDMKTLKSIDIEHIGFHESHKGKCYPDLYLNPSSNCIKCSGCERIFNPTNFVTHCHISESDRTQPETKSICHWGFKSENWRSIIHIDGENDSEEDAQALDSLKKRFEALEQDNQLFLLQQKPNTCNPSSNNVKQSLGNHAPLAKKLRLATPASSNNENLFQFNSINLPSQAALATKYALQQGMSPATSVEISAASSLPFVSHSNALNAMPENGGRKTTLFPPTIPYVAPSRDINKLSGNASSSNAIEYRQLSSPRNASVNERNDADGIGVIKEKECANEGKAKSARTNCSPSLGEENDDLATMEEISFVSEWNKLFDQRINGIRRKLHPQLNASFVSLLSDIKHFSRGNKTQDLKRIEELEKRVEQLTLEKDDTIEKETSATITPPAFEMPYPTASSASEENMSDLKIMLHQRDTEVARLQRESQMLVNVLSNVAAAAATGQSSQLKIPTIEELKAHVTMQCNSANGTVLWKK